MSQCCYCLWKISYEWRIVVAAKIHSSRSALPNSTGAATVSWTRWPCSRQVMTSLVWASYVLCLWHHSTHSLHCCQPFYCWRKVSAFYGHFQTWSYFYFSAFLFRIQHVSVLGAELVIPIFLFPDVATMSLNFYLTVLFSMVIGLQWLGPAILRSLTGNLWRVLEWSRNKQNTERQYVCSHWIGILVCVFNRSFLFLLCS